MLRTLFDNRAIFSLNRTMLPWLDKNLKNIILESFSKYKDIPDFVGYNLPSISTSMDSFNIQKYLPENSSTLYKENYLLLDTVKILSRRLEYYDQVNIINISEASIENIVPIIFEFKDTQNLGNFTQISPNRNYNTHICNRLQEVCEELETNLEVHSKELEPELKNFPINKQDKQVNLFLLLNSRLGNSRTPRTMLRNIYDSMHSGDYLILLQGIFKPNMEDELVKNYEKLLNDPDYAEVDKDLLNLFTDEYQKVVRWNDSDKLRGVEMIVKSDKGLKFADVQLEPSQELAIFRSFRFSFDYLFTTLKSIGFIPNSIEMDDTLENAIFTLKKL